MLTPKNIKTEYIKPTNIRRIKLIRKAEDKVEILNIPIRIDKLWHITNCINHSINQNTYKLILINAYKI